MNERRENPFERFFWLVAGSAAGGLVLGLVAVVTAYTQFGAMRNEFGEVKATMVEFAKQKVEFEYVKASISEIRTSLASGTQDRYTATAAANDRAAFQAASASDRAAFMATFTATVEAITRGHADTIKATNDRLQAISIRQTEFDRTLKELSEFKVRAEERERRNQP